VLGLLKLPFVVFLAVADVMLDTGSTAQRPTTTTTNTPEDPAVAAHRKRSPRSRLTGRTCTRPCAWRSHSVSLARAADGQTLNTLVNGYDLTAPEASLAQPHRPPPGPEAGPTAARTPRGAGS